MSLNAVHTLPTDLPLPLRKLYLADNIVLQNVTLTAAFNLAYLNLAGCELKQFPSIGTLPNLKVHPMDLLYRVADKSRNGLIIVLLTWLED